MPAVGQAWYELNARDQGVLQSMSRVESKIRGSGTAAEAAFGGTATTAFTKAGRAAEGVTRPVGRVSGLMQDLSYGRGLKPSFFGDDGFFGGAASKASAAAGKFGGAIKGVGGVMTAVGIPPILGWAGAAAAAVGVMGKAISAASDLQETQSKVGVVFGQSSADILKWGATSATAFGQSQTQALGAAATFGNLFVALKLPSDQIPKMSTGLTELASDLASFNNVPVEDALMALRSGLVGETEPLRRFGVNLNEATIAQKALDMGLISSVKEAITPAIKSQATYALILDQTGTAQGDFARTSTGLANQQRIAAARVEDAMAKFGATLLPIAQTLLPQFIDAATGLLGVLGELAGALSTAGAAVEGFLNGIHEPLQDLARNLNIWHLMGPEVEASAIEFWNNVTGSTATAIGSIDRTMGAFPGKVADDLVQGAPMVAAAAVDAFGRPILKGAQYGSDGAVKVASKTPHEVADALRDGIFDVTGAMADLRDAMKNTLSPAKEMAAIEGFLTGKFLARGLNDNRPAVRAEFEAYKADAEARLRALKVEAANQGDDTGDVYAERLGAKREEVGRRAGHMVGGAREPMQDFQHDAGGYGSNTGDAYIDGMADALEDGMGRISTKVGNIAKIVAAGSPPKYRESPLYGIDRWGFGTGESYGSKLAEGITTKVGAIKAAVGKLLPEASGGMGVDVDMIKRRVNFEPGAVESRGNGTSIGMLKIDVDMNIEKLNANSPADVLGLGRSLGNEIRLSLTRTPTSFFRVNG